MANINLRPANINFYGVWLTPGGNPANNSYFYENWNFATQFKPQIDAAKAAGLNCVSFAGDVHWFSDGSGLTLTQYLACHKELLDYCLKIGMYVICYHADSWVNWSAGTGYDQTGPTQPSWANGQTIIAASAALHGLYPNVVGIVILDEPIQSGMNITFSNSNGVLLTKLTSIYNAVKAVVPADLPVCGCPNSSGNDASPVWDYAGSGAGSTKFNVDQVASICDFFAYHPFANETSTPPTALQVAYPSKQIAMPSTVAQNDGTGGLTALINSIWSLVGANNFCMASFFLALDYPLGATANTLGCFNADYSQKAGKIGPMQSNILAPTSQRPMRPWAGSPRLNQYQAIGYAA